MVDDVCYRCILKHSLCHCKNCGIAFITLYKGPNTYCLSTSCFRSRHSSYRNPNWREILPAEEPFVHFYY